MKDPFYAGLVFQIEQMICLADEEAKEASLTLNDSQIQSALIKAQKLVKGGVPKVPEATDRERVLSKLIMSLYHAPDALMKETTAPDGTREERPLSISEWVKALETTVDSIKTRKDGAPGSREYLEFVHEFIAQARTRN
jgi:hypothetical protein